MNITLTPEQERYIQFQLEEGKYSSVEQLISEALQLLEERNRAREEKPLETLQQKRARGQLTGGDVAFAKLQEKIHLMSESEVILANANPSRDISQKVQELFKQTQALPGVQDITEEDISTEIEAYRRGE